MNQFKEDVLRELQDVKLTNQKNSEMAKKARMKSKVRRSGEWQYRIVFATFTLCMVFFSYFFLQDDDQRADSQQGAAIQKEVDSSPIWRFLEYDLVKGILLFAIHFGITLIIKHILPECVQCGENFSHKKARKFFGKIIQLLLSACTVVKNNIVQTDRCN